jgi:phosphoribosyl 1,2-cyclic phosphodiesterase
MSGWLRFWGVRGSLPTPGLATACFGGNTACVEVRLAGRVIILDAGSGLRELGDALAAEYATLDVDLLLTHAHFDHICGLPFFAPMYRAADQVRLWAGHLPAGQHIGDILSVTLSEPLMPSLTEAMLASVTYHDFTAGEAISLAPGLLARSRMLRHPGGACGYRLESGGVSVAYVTDTEHPTEGFDSNVLELAAGTDVMIYDANYSETDYADHVGWGHSTWEHAVALADAAQAELLVLFHHNLTYNDARMRQIEAAATARRPATIVAREGMRLDLPLPSHPPGPALTEDKAPKSS